MKTKQILPWILILSLLLVFTGCGTTGAATSSSSPTPPVSTSAINDADLFITEDLSTGYSKTTIPEIQAVIKTTLPLPAVLPEGYEIQEVYSNTQSEILALISDQPVAWEGQRFRCRLIFYTDWNAVAGGFKELTGKSGVLPDTSSVLIQKNNKYILYWQNWSVHSETLETIAAISRLYSSDKFPEDELVNIAASVPWIVSNTPRIVPTGPKVTNTVTGIPSPVTILPTTH